MDNAKVEYAAKAAGAISALAALCTLSITLVQIRNDYQKAQIREWQEVVVYSMIADAAGAGMTTTELQNKYRGAAVDLPQELPREEIQTQALKRTLLNLISKGAITQRPDGRYAFSVGPVPLPVDIFERAKRLQPIGDFIIQTIVAQPNRYTVQELAQKCTQQFRQQITEEEFNLLVGQLSGMGALKVGAGGKVSPTR